jgi:hypothetical protein
MDAVGGYGAEMQWWNNFVDWVGSDQGWRIISGAIIPFLAIVIAGFVAAAIGRGSTKRLLSLNDRELSAAAVAALIAAGRRASVWNTLTVPEQQHAEHLANEADVRIRLLPLTGAASVANWADHEILDMRKNSATFSFQAEQSLMDFRDRVIQWRDRPSRAKKLFQDDLDNWRYSATASDHDLKVQQQAWTDQQAQPRVEHSGPVVSVPPIASVPPMTVPTASVPPVEPRAPQIASVVPPTYAPPVEPQVPEGDISTPAAPSSPIAIGPIAPKPERPNLVEPEPVRPEPVTYPSQPFSQFHPGEPPTGPVEQVDQVDEIDYPAPMPVFRARERINPPTND